MREIIVSPGLAGYHSHVIDDRSPQKDERARRALTLLLKLGPAIAVTIGDWKPEVEAVYRRAHELGREVADGPQLFRAAWGLWLCASRTDNKQSRKWTEELTSLAQRLGDESLLLEAQHCRWGDDTSRSVHVKFFNNNQNRMQITTNVCELSFALPKI